jgi:DNA-binding HxlR family transcriptional regulator
MARTKDYSHFCPVARSLEVIGEKWSLLVVRDLLRGPQRFTDLHRYLGGITPKWLSARLRELERVGIVERDQQPGRREVWYRLTDTGRELMPVVQALAVWGMDHAMRAPQPGEVAYPEQFFMAVATYLNRKRVVLPLPVTWQLRFDGRPSAVLTFDGERWRYRPGEAEADLEVSGAPQDWVDLLTAPRAERPPLIERLTMVGPDERAAEFRETLLRVGGLTVPAARSAAV